MGGERAPAKQRFEWVDAARGIGILAVVVGHVWTRGPVRDIMYSFHMPLFFLLSGYLFRPKPVGAFARKQLLSLGLSYLAFLLLVLALDTVIETAQGQSHRPIFHRWPGDIAKLAFGGSDLRGPFTVFWFLPCLVAARILFNAVSARLPDPFAPAWVAIAAISLVIAYIGGWATDVSPLGLLTVPMAFFLLWAGAAWNVVGWRNGMLWLLLPLSLAGLWLAGLSVLPTLNMKAGDYGWPVVSIAGAMATSFLIFRLGHLRPFNMPPVRALGRASLVIMYLHVPVIHYLSPLGKPMVLVLAILIPLSVHFLFDRTALTRRIFLAQ